MKETRVDDGDLDTRRQLDRQTDRTKEQKKEQKKGKAERTEDEKEGGRAGQPAASSADRALRPARKGGCPLPRTFQLRRGEARQRAGPSGPHGVAGRDWGGTWPMAVRDSQGGTARAEGALQRGWAEALGQERAHAPSLGHAETRRLAGTPLGHTVIQVLRRKTPKN